MNRVIEPETTSIEEIIGRTFLRKKHYLREKDKETLYSVQECDNQELTGCKFVLLFFSAAWCPPCQQFTQVLKDFYHEVNIDGKVIEVLYISLDRNEAEFKDAYAKMPWLTYRFENEMHTKIREYYDIKGVPYCFVLDPVTGFLISKKGRKDICDLGVTCLKNWADEISEQKTKQQLLREGFAIAEEYRIKKEAEEKRKREEEEKL